MACKKFSFLRFKNSKPVTNRLRLTLGILLLAASTTLSADTTPTIALNQPVVTLKAANHIITAALQNARSQNWTITVAVVDSSGELVALAKDDNAIGISPSVAIGKAKTAALLRKPSKEFETYINQGKPSFLSTPTTTPLEGGIPLLYDGQFIGAVGVSGAHGANDSAVAQIAADSIKGGIAQ